jgi:hypothetical protein
LMSAKKLMGSSVLCACISPRSYSPLAQATPSPRDFFHEGNSSLQVGDQLCNSPKKLIIYVMIFTSSLALLLCNIPTLF